MTPEEFRTYGRLAVDWIADYLERIESYPVLSQVSPGEVRAQLPARPPERGEPFEAVLADLEKVVLPGITHWQHPSFFAYFPSNASGPAILADLLSAGLGVQGMLWATSPACTELEQHVLDWLAELLDLPAAFRSDGPGGGVIQDTASSSILLALLAALHRATGGAARHEGVRGAGGPEGQGDRDREGYAVYASTQVHSALVKASIIAGLGAPAVREIPVDPTTLAMDVAGLREAIEADQRAGIIPVMAVATVGTTSTSAIDPVGEIGEVCREHGIWLHVDAAYAGVAAVCPELRWINDGVGYADSYCTNPHKWLLTNFDCDAFYVADRAPLIGALSILPEYLRNAATESGAVVDYRDWQVPLGRRFRALKLWAVIRWYGTEGLREHIRGHVAAAQEFAEWVRAHPRFEIAAPHPLSLVCFRLRGGEEADEANAALMERLNASGELYLTHTKVNDRVTLRLAIGTTLTERRHVEAAWRRIQEAAAALAG
ncbi:MAG: aspartate aminotransferase family protein [Streptosporangiales bacterium]|nr:aspartate aminotransferase family protein [Streptosporangiales bacterium]